MTPTERACLELARVWVRNFPEAAGSDWACHRADKLNLLMQIDAVLAAPQERVQSLRSAAANGYNEGWRHGNEAARREAAQDEVCRVITAINSKAAPQEPALGNGETCSQCHGTGRTQRLPWSAAAPQEPAQSSGDLVGLSHIRSCFERARAPQRGCTCGCDECAYCVAKAAPPEPNATPLGRARLAIKALADEAANQGRRKYGLGLYKALDVVMREERG